MLEALLDFWSCRPGLPTRCCKCEHEEEVLTAAWVEKMDRVSALPPEERQRFRDGPLGFKDPMSGDPSRSPAGSDVDLGGGQAKSASREDASAGLGRLGALAVPPEFEGARRAVLEASRPPAADGSPVSAEDLEESRRCLQVSLKAFTRALLRGITVSVLLDDGRTRLAEARLDSELSHLVLHVPHAQHPVALKCIEAISSGEAGVHDQVPALHQQSFLSDRCATLIIQGGQFLSFVFDSTRTREYFEMCLKIIVLASDQHAPCPPPAPRRAAGRQPAGGDGGDRPPPAATSAARPGDEGPTPSVESSPVTAFSGLGATPTATASLPPLPLGGMLRLEERDPVVPQPRPGGGHARVPSGGPLTGPPRVGASSPAPADGPQPEARRHISMDC